MAAVSRRRLPHARAARERSSTPPVRCRVRLGRARKRHRNSTTSTAPPSSALTRRCNASRGRSRTSSTLYDESRPHTQAPLANSNPSRSPLHNDSRHQLRATAAQTQRAVPLTARVTQPIVNDRLARDETHHAVDRQLHAQVMQGLSDSRPRWTSSLCCSSSQREAERHRSHIHGSQRLDANGGGCAASAQARRRCTRTFVDATSSVPRSTRSRSATSSQLHDVDRAALLGADAATQRLARSRPNVIYPPRRHHDRTPNAPLANSNPSRSPLHNK